MLYGPRLPQPYGGSHSFHLASTRKFWIRGKAGAAHGLRNSKREPVTHSNKDCYTELLLYSNLVRRIQMIFTLGQI